MSGSARRGRRASDHEDEEHENEERWLVSFADMMTLMFALFMVLFSISSVNTSKFESLKRSLQDSFSGSVLPGGESVRETGADSTHSDPLPTSEPAPPLRPRDAATASLETSSKQARADAAAVEQKDFSQLKQRIDAQATQLGVRKEVSTVIRERGLVVRLITDGVLFDSGKGELRPGAERLLTPLAALLRREERHPIVVEGYTDTEPIASAAYPTNWELSGARATRVVRAFAGDGLPVRRLSGVAYAWQHPVASNATAAGRARNRRVEVVLTRQNPRSPSGGRA